MHYRILALSLLLCGFAHAQSGPFVITSASSQCASIGVGGPVNAVGIDVEGTFSITLQPEISLSGRPPKNTSATPSTSTSGALQATITAAGYYQVNVSGYSEFEVCPTAYASGTATIYLYPGTGPTNLSGSSSASGSNVTVVGPVDGSNNVLVDLATALPAGANIIGAVTESGTWNVRTQDGSGNALTSNSTTYTSKFALDVNLLGVAGAVFSATNPLFGRLTDGTTAMTADLSAYGTAPTGTEAPGVNAFITNGPDVLPQPGAGSAVAVSVSTQSALTTAVVVKASTGNIYGLMVTNGAASVCYLEFMNTASGPSLGTNAAYSIPVAASSSVIIPVGVYGPNLTTGISVGMATANNGSSACGTAATATIFYK